MADVTSLTLSEAIARYEVFAKDYYRKPPGEDGRPGRLTGEHKNMGDALRFVRELHGSLCPDEFRPAQLRACQQAMIAAGLSRKVINARVNRIRRFFKWCVSYELADIATHQRLQTVDPLKRGRTKAKEKKPVRPVAWEVVSATIQAVEQEARAERKNEEALLLLAAAVRVQWHTGLRPRELLSMRACDIDRPTNGSVAGQPATGVWWFVPADHKAAHHGRERRIPLGPAARAELAPLLTRSTFQGSFAFVDPPALFPYTTATYRQQLQRVAARHGLPHWFPYQIRHAFATRVRKEFGIEVAQLWLGHADGSTTQIYAEADLLKVADAAERFG